jgi:chemotaxis methyl-accepting protein methylase
VIDYPSTTPMHHPSDEDDAFARLSDKITRETSFRCASYKDKCLRRRIAVRMRARNVESYDAYARVLDGDAREYERLLDALTINVTKFFRNWPTFESLARNVIPQLWAQGGNIRVWSAGTSSGEEAYSLAGLFYQQAMLSGEVHRISRVTVIGSDIDRGSLAAAERAVYPPTAFSDTPDDLADAFFPRQGNGTSEMRSAIPQIRSMVRFERRDLLREQPPIGPFDLIACRNVIIYFDRPAQEELFAKFHYALAPDGYLLLGRVETLLGRPRSWFVPIDLRERIFRRGE